MSKRIFRIEAGRYGGETVIGQVDKEFVEKFIDEGEGELIEHLTSTDDMDFEGMLPKKDYYMWECDDIEHINSAYGDSGFFVTEVTNEESKYDYSESETEFEPVSCLYGREAYSQDEMPDDEDIKDGDNYVPVINFHSGEKGNFGCWFVETDGEPFDKYKFTYGIVETNMGEFIDSAWYDEKELETEYDYAESMGKGYYASVGYMNKKWHDNREKYSEEKLDPIYWEDFNDNVEYEKKEASTTVALNISAEEIVGEVGTIENPGEVDPTIEPINEPPVVSQQEADSYKELQDQLTQLNGHDDGRGEEGEEL
tara:strand:+ start:244 stop:1176 length:933 start_codon:yes stop_codon:yes gene_type:complete